MVLAEAMIAACQPDNTKCHAYYRPQAHCPIAQHTHCTGCTFSIESRVVLPQAPVSYIHVRCNRSTQCSTVYAAARPRMCSV
jgi:hypothetical protein